MANSNNKQEEVQKEILNRIERIENKLGLYNISEDKEKDLFLELQTEGVVLDDVIMTTQKKNQLLTFVNEQKNKERIKKYNLKPINTLLFFGGAGSGKGAPLNTHILTPKGWITMGDVKIGDVIFDGNGNPTKVIGTFPQGKRDVYRIYFSDRTFIEVDDEHLNIFYQVSVMESHRIKNPERRIRKWGKLYKTLTTVELVEYFKKELKKARHAPLRLDVPIINFKKQKVEMNPYILGVILGDGCVTSEKTFGLTNMEKDVVEAMSKYCKKNGTELKLVYDKRREKNKQCQYRIKQKDEIWKQIEKIGINGTNSKTKFIPKEYLYNDYETRLELLKGLMDTDGYVSNRRSKKGYLCCAYEYTTISKRLSDDFAFLVRSLGCVDTISEKIGKYRDKNGEVIECSKVYRHYLKIPNGLQIFNCERKKKRQKDRQEEASRKIIKIVKKKEKEECKCILVSSKAHTYIMDNVTPTHNTMTCKALSNELQYKIYTMDISQVLGGANPLKSIKEAFDYANSHQPCLLFLDEVDGIVPQRGSKKTSQETAQITNYIMQVLNEMNQTVDNDVVVLCASNFLTGIDDAFRNRFAMIMNLETPYNKVEVIRSLMQSINKKAGMDAFELVEDAEEEVIKIINEECASDEKKNVSIRQIEFLIKRIIKKELLKSKEEVIKIYLTDILKEICIMMQWNMDDEIISTDEYKRELEKEKKEEENDETMRLEQDD